MINGKSSWDMVVGNETINGVAAPLQYPNTLESNRFKILAYCNGNESPYTPPLPGTSSSQKIFISLKLLFASVLILVF